ncbi:hypothetical protein POG22_08320 [Geitlerinema sp. CS-897]|nr:hypothetical protein [Geitlerinema sp. CS-897]
MAEDPRGPISPGFFYVSVRPTVRWKAFEAMLDFSGLATLLSACVFKEVSRTSTPMSQRSLRPFTGWATDEFTRHRTDFSLAFSNAALEGRGLKP